MFVTLAAAKRAALEESTAKSGRRLSPLARRIIGLDR